MSIPFLGLRSKIGCDACVWKETFCPLYMRQEWFCNHWKGKYRVSAGVHWQERILGLGGGNLRASVMRSASSPDIREQAVFVIDSIPIRPRPYRTQATCWTLGLLVSLVISKTTHAKQKANRKTYKFPGTCDSRGYCANPSTAPTCLRVILLSNHLCIVVLRPVHRENLKHPRVIPLTCGWISRGNLIAVLWAVRPLSPAAQFPWRPASCLSLCACVCASSFVNNGPFVYYMSYFNKPAPCICPPATHPFGITAQISLSARPPCRLISLSLARPV